MYMLFQVAGFSAKGLLVAHISGEQDDEKVKRNVVDGLYQMVYFTPEMLL